MRVLVAVANHGTRNRAHLDRLLAEYRSIVDCHVHLVVLSNIPKDLGKDVEVRVGLPSPNPWSLPFAHRSLFAERCDDYDVFVYSEDDTLVTRKNIFAFIRADELLEHHELAGFIRSEQAPDGTVYYSSIHSFFRWDPGSVVQRGNELFASFTNEHAACYMLTRAKLRRALASGGFLVPPHEGRHDMLCAAATDPYTQCGLSRLVCISSIDDFVLPHLPNKYIGRFGVPRDELQAQIAALCSFRAKQPRWLGPLVEPETKLRHARWSKNLYPMCDDLLRDAVPQSVRRILVVGSGWGVVEQQLAQRGHDVTCVPVDPLFGSRLRARGLSVLEGSQLTNGNSAESNEAFDCVVLLEVLHLVPDPAGLLASVLRRTRTHGIVTVISPNIDTLPRYVRGLFKGGSPAHKGFAASGVHPLNARRVCELIRGQGVRPHQTIYEADRGRRFPSWRPLQAWVADRFAVVGIKECTD